MTGGLKAIIVAALLACSVVHAVGSDSEGTGRANPIRRVVTMLQMMAKKVAEEGKREDELYEKFMCYCETSGSDLKKSIGDGETKMPQLVSDIKEAEGAKEQLEQDLQNHRQDRADAKAAIEKATGIREKEHAEFAKAEAEASSNIKALRAAIAAIEKGMAGSFLQTDTAAKLRKLVVSLQLNDLTDFDRRMVVEFLSTNSAQKQEYSPKSGEIVGILKQMGDEMDKDYMELTTQEEEAVKLYNELVAAKEKEIAEATKAIEAKTVRVGELSVEIVQMRNDLGETEEALMDDKKFLADLEKNCATKQKEQAERQKTRSEEILAIQETIKILNDDDALELFKKAIPSSALIQDRALIQVQTSEAGMRHKALKLVKQVRKLMRGGNAQLDLIAMALSGKKVGFEKVIKLIDDMVVTLKKEQTDDDDKKEYCEIQLDHVDDMIKETSRSVSDLETKIADCEEGITQTVEELKALQDGIIALDKSVVVATEQRKEENAEYTELMANDSTAKELIAFAKNRMNKFYNPKLYKPPPKRELTEEERITLNMGGTLEPTPSPAGIAGTGIGFVQLHSQIRRGGEDQGAAPPPPPETPGEYKKKGEESNGVIGMMDMLIGDLDKEMTEAKAEEKNAQEEYEAMMSDAKDKRAEDSKAMTEKEAAKANMETELQGAKDAKDAETKELVATREYMANLHGECDWLLENFDLRKEARAQETDALKKAKAVLSGADFSLVQTKAHSLRR